VFFYYLESVPKLSAKLDDGPAFFDNPAAFSALLWALVSLKDIGN
jgi:hypothetical protein